nr:SEY1 [Cryptomonas curvata]
MLKLFFCYCLFLLLFLNSYLMENIHILDIIGAKICEEILLNSLSLYKKAIEPWLVCSNEGGIIQNFGKEVDILINEILTTYEKDACMFRTTKIFLQKKEFLKESMIFDLQKTFEKQVFKVKEVSLQNFKESLAPIQISNRVEKDIQAVIQAVDRYFREIVKSLTSKYSLDSWFFEKEYRELVQEMREISIERLQLAKLQGVYVQKNKHPIALSFHFLHPHPFGKDLRFDHMTSNDSFNFNSNFNQKAGIMRQSISSKSNSVKIISPDSPAVFPDSDLIYQDNPLSAFQNNNN